MFGAALLSFSETEASPADVSDPLDASETPETDSDGNCVQQDASAESLLDWNWGWCFCLILLLLLLLLIPIVMQRDRILVMMGTGPEPENTISEPEFMEGAVIASLANFSAFTLNTIDTWKEFEDGADLTAEGFQTAANVIGQISGIMAAHSGQQIKEIDKQIAAEKKRDGKSAESLAKIKEMEKKKEAMERKRFNQQKKLMMAQTIANTAAGIMKTVGETGFFGIPMALIIAAMGAAQLAIISKQKYEGSSGSVSEPQRQALNIGKAANKIDVSRGAQAGEIGYLRGQRGMPGGAAGMKRYADGGPIVVGERGPEVIQPTTSGYKK